MSNIESFYPAVLYELEPGDDGYAKGARFRLDQLDGGQYWFPDRESAEYFADIHDLSLINEAEMLALRRALNDMRS